MMQDMIYLHPFFNSPEDTRFYLIGRKQVFICGIFLIIQLLFCLRKFCYVILLLDEHHLSKN